MATTLIENIVNELTMVVVQSVMKEFQAQEARLTVLEKGFETLAQQRLKGLTDPLDHEARLNALERADFVRRADLCSNFVTRDDLLVDEALINDRLAAMERALAAQPVVDANFVDERVERWMRENLNNEIVDALERVDIDYKIQRAIEDTDFDDEIKEAVYERIVDDERIDDELESRGFIDEEDLQRYLDQYRFVTEGSLIEFLNDRVRITAE